MKVYTLYDKKAGAFQMSSLPTFQNNELAKRGFQVAFLNGALGDIPNRYPEDFDLYSLGEFDVKTGDLISNKEFVCNLTDLKQEAKDNG